MGKQKNPAVAAEHSWHLYMNREGLQVSAGRHLKVSLSLPLLAWGASVSGLLVSASHWVQLLA